MFNWLFKRAAIEKTPEPEPRESLPERAGRSSTHDMDDGDKWQGVTTGDYVNRLVSMAPTPPKLAPGEVVAAMDSTEGSGEAPEFKQRLAHGAGAVSDALALWYASQTFIGHQLAALIAQHWLVDKACEQPAKDAIRKGYTIASADGEELPPEVSALLDRSDRHFGVRKNILEFIHLGRVFGIRIAIFKVKGIDYSAPFNIDGVQPGSYEGIVQVDPYWCTPELDADASSKPDTMHFYEPTFWRINGVRYHRSHLIIFRNGMLPDLLKPAYMYGGIPVPQQIMERVYGAERTANEAPLLALTKRTTVYKVDMSAAMANFSKFSEKVSKWAKFWSNNGVRVINNDEEINQVDTGLADLDTVIMTQYQIVAAAARVPATKLLGTSPKGFNSEGAYEEASYHEMLESLQEDVSPLLNRHHKLVLRSIVTPKYPDAANLHVMAMWEPLDSMTAKEKADVELVQAQAGAALVQSGAIDAIDERNRLIADKDSPYVNLPPVERGNQPVNDDGAQ